MYCIVTVMRFVIILIKFYVCMYVCMTINDNLTLDEKLYFGHLLGKVGPPICNLVSGAI